MGDPRAEAVLEFWFGAGDDAARKRWFEKDATFDEEIRQRFGELVDRALDGELDAWAKEPRSALALVILLDQFPRNLFRGSDRAFAGDEHAERIARGAIAAGHAKALSPVELAILYMPFMHSELRETQRESVAYFDGLAAKAAGPDRGYLAAAADFARRHARIIERFGRFPHRNAILGRTSTPDEVDFMSEPGSRF